MADNNANNSSSVTYEATINSVGPLLLRINRKVKRKWREDITPNELYEHLMCKICAKFLNNPLTITRCMHSFCNACLMEHIKKYRSCPTCLKLIHPLRPIVNVKKDVLLQRLICKLFPQNFVDKNKPNITDNKNITDELSNKRQFKRYPIFTGKEQISISLNPSENCLENKQDEMQRYLQCPAKMPINLLEKFVLSKYNLDAEKYMVNFKYEGNQDLKSSYKLMDIAYIYQWNQLEPLSLVYEIGSTLSELEEIEIKKLPFSIITVQPDNNKTIEILTDINTMEEKMGNNNHVEEKDKNFIKDIAEESSESYVASNISSSPSPLYINSETEANNQMIETRKKPGRKQKSLESVIMSLRPKQLQNDNGAVNKNIDSIKTTNLPTNSEHIQGEAPMNKACTCCKLLDASPAGSVATNSTVLHKSPSKACQTDIPYPAPINGLKRMFNGLDQSHVKKQRLNQTNHIKKGYHSIFNEQQFHQMHNPQIIYNRPIYNDQVGLQRYTRPTQLYHRYNIQSTPYLPNYH